MSKQAVGFRLSPEAVEGLEQLCRALEKNQGQVVDYLILTELARRGYVFEPEKARLAMKVEIKTRDGRELPVIQHNGELFVAGLKDTEYSVRLINHSMHRRLAILSIDGINAVNGKDADFSGPGYVLDPWSSFDILGWFRTNQEVASFKFGAGGASYAKQTGRSGKDVGVIGVAVFDELRPYSGILRSVGSGQSGSMGGILYNSPPEGGTFCATSSDPHAGQTMRGATMGMGGTDRAEYSANTITMSSLNMEREVRSSGINPGAPRESVVRTSAGPASRMKSAKGGPKKRSVPQGSGDLPHANETQQRRGPMDFMSADLGTEYGAKAEMKTGTCSFTRSSETPVEMVQVRYASAEVLKSWGVPVGQVPIDRPNAFPAQVGVKAPPGWAG